jgi:hypothetical protein
MTQTAPKQPKTPVPGTVAALARDTAQRLGLDEPRAAEYFGVPVYTWRKWSTGEREPGAAVARLLEVLGMIEALAPNLHHSFLPRLTIRPTRGRRAAPSPAHNSVMSENPV